ncbi:MAG TPA: sigma-70 family RNA polymerase sigma factor [Candidatus Paceibacterota bacterium]|nr:sigma-70 family RNA polymerase sigma factor [Verrucomicrobiota bacterium]HSA10523.1 sigma-70 family RNA polymerase sigma factor [Candidatus Paceibacterota bacterium]
MPTSDSSVSSTAPLRPQFVTTHWSVVLQAQDKASAGSDEALDTLCRTYWYPLYAFVRASGYPPHAAQDLTQEFFARLLSKDYLRAVDPGKGRFRTFLRMALKRFLANEWDRLSAQKRGGLQTHLSFDTSLAEERFQDERGGALTPDRIYDRRWALTLLTEALGRLEREHSSAGKAGEWDHLEPHLMQDRSALPYAEIASRLQTTEGAARVALHRLRKRFREIFRETIANTVADPAEVESEMRQVLEALSQA